MMKNPHDHDLTAQQPSALLATDASLDFSPFPPVSGGACSPGYIASAIWGNTCQYYLTPHGTQATWDPTYPSPCNIYNYAWSYCMEGCTHPGADISMDEGTPL